MIVPISRTVGPMSSPSKAKPTPTPKASMLVATARPYIVKGPVMTLQETSSCASLIIPMPIQERIKKMIQWA